MFQKAKPQKGRPSRGPQRIRAGNRMLVACINCKERKLKCDDQVPACANCHRFGLICLVEDPATKRHQPRNYLETLEQRVALLEGILQQFRPDLAHDHLSQGSQGDFQRPEYDPTSPSGTQSTNNEYGGRPSAPRIGDGPDGLDGLASKVGMLSLNAAGAEPHYLGSSSTFAFSRIINSSLRQVVSKKPNGQFGQSHDDFSTPAPCLLPDHEVAVRLSNAYFENIHPQYPFLHEPTFRSWEATLIHPSKAFDALGFDPLPLYFLNMVYAVGALLLPNSGHSPERLYISAQLYIDHILPRENLEAIQAILCCAVYSLRSSIGTSHWKLAGLALRQCIDLGYHRNTKYFKLTADPLRLEMRKRVFWCAYVMECAAAVMLGRPLGMRDQEIDAEYPMDIDDSCLTGAEICGTPRSSPSDPPTSMTKSIHAFRIRCLWGVVHTSLYSDTMLRNPCDHSDLQIRIEKLRAELEDWRASIPRLPPPPTEPIALFPTADWFQLNYNYTILQLHRIPITDPKGGCPDSVFFECVHAAEAICHGYRRQFFGKPTGFTWGALHELFLAGLTYLHCLWASPAVREATREDQVSSTCTDCTIVLVIMAERWDTTAPYRDIFEALASRTMTMVVDSSREKSTLPGAVVAASAEQDGLDPADLTQWMAGIADTGMSEGMDRLLTGLIGDWPSSQEQQDAGLGGSSWEDDPAGYPTLD